MPGLTVNSLSCSGRSPARHYGAVTRARIAVLILVLGLAAAGATAGEAISSSAAPLPGLMTGKGPWGPNNGLYLRQRLKAIGLHALPAEGVALHIHAHLDLAVNGRLYPVPALIGINVGQRFITELHTHDQSGIIHVESPTVRTFTLGQFFDVWGLRLSPRCVGGYCARGKKQVWVWANAKRVRTDPRKIVLRSHQEIVVAYGTLASVRALGPVPATYPFPQGY
jgi:hypothetical protein